MKFNNIYQDIVPIIGFPSPAGLVPLTALCAFSFALSAPLPPAPALPSSLILDAPALFADALCLADGLRADVLVVERQAVPALFGIGAGLVGVVG